MAEIKVGKVTHYFDKIGVAVVKLEDSLSVGDQIKIIGREEEFIQTVGSMQVEYQPIQTAKKGDVVGMKVEKPVRKGDEVFKITE